MSRRISDTTAVIVFHWTWFALALVLALVVLYSAEKVSGLLKAGKKRFLGVSV